MPTPAELRRKKALGVSSADQRFGGGSSGGVGATGYWGDGTPKSGGSAPTGTGSGSGAATPPPNIGSAPTGGAPSQATQEGKNRNALAIAAANERRNALSAGGTGSGVSDPNQTGAANGITRGENVREQTFPGQTAFDSSFNSPTFSDAKDRLADVQGRKDERTQEVIDLMKNQGNIRQSAIDKLFGEDSRISQFYQPAIQTVEEQLLDTEGLLSNLSEDIVDRNKDVGLTSSQQRRIEAKEKGELTKQFDELTRSHQRLRSGLDIAMNISDKEFNAIVEDSKQAIETAVFELQNTGMEDNEIALIQSALNQQLQRDTEFRSEERIIAQEIRAEEQADRKLSKAQLEDRRTQVEGILSNAMDLAFQTGAGPTEGFNQVISDVQAMLDRGATVSEIEVGVLRAIGSNPTIRKYIMDQLKPLKSSGGGTSGTKLSSTQQLALAAAGITGKITVDQLTPEEAKIASNSSSGDISF